MTPTAGSYLVLLLLLVVSTILSPHFFTSGNLFNIGRQAAPLAIVALGETLVILVGGIDVSVGAMISLTVVIAAGFMNSTNSRIAPTVLVVLALGVVVGCVNGTLIAVLGADPFVTTLGTMLILKGAGLVYTQGSPSANLTYGFRLISEGSILSIPTPIYAVAVLFVLSWFALGSSVWGRQIYAVGSNSRAARLSGQPTIRTQVSAYVVCSLLAGAAGLFLVARLGGGDINAGAGYELDAIAAVMIGGTAFGGGRGGVTGTVAGVLILTCLYNLVSILALANYVELIVRGAAIICGVALYSRAFYLARA
jgi:ribose/xylose/arabinose/galactoside ABC-type transport system permease subunit